MSPEARSRYFGHYWPAACEAKGWRAKDEVRRRHTTGECMRLIRALQVESVTLLGPDEITALFCYLEFLANPSSLAHSQRWLDCQQDYRAYNRARQADWHERQTYGRSGSNKLRKNRFAGQQSAQGKPQETFDPEAARKRHLTMVSRHRTKLKKQQPGDLRFVAEVAGRVVTGPAPAPVNRVAAHVESEESNCPF